MSSAPITSSRSRSRPRSRLFRRAVLLALLFSGASLLACNTSSSAKAGSGSAPSGAILSPDQVSKHIGESATVEFTITRVGTSKNAIFLNSQRERGGFTGYIPLASKDAFTKAFGEDLKAALEGKTVQLSGELVMFKETPEIVLKSPDQLKIIR